VDFLLSPPPSVSFDPSVSVAMFHSNLGWRIGAYDADAHKTFFCCTPELVQARQCNALNSVIWNDSNVAASAFYLTRVSFDRDDWHAKLNITYEVAMSGIYYLYVFNCNNFGAGAPTKLFLTGAVTFHNPTGYLSADLWPNLPFYGTVSLVYLLIGVCWFGVSLRHWRKLLAIQNWIAGVVFLGMAESATVYFENLAYNADGLEDDGVVVFSTLLSAFKLTVSRVLVLVVAMGYGVVKPTLGTTRYKVTLLGVIYFVFGAALLLVQARDRSAEISWAAALFLVVPVAVLDTGFYWWIFLSLLRTIAQLKARRQVVKLNMYQWLFNTLAASAVVSTVVVLYQVIAFSITHPDDHWRTAWLWPAFWEVLYLIVLVALAALWRPTANNTRYAYADVRSGGAEGDGGEAGVNTDIDGVVGDVPMADAKAIGGIVLRHAPGEDDAKPAAAAPKRHD
jgi:hypothetical protein